MLELPGSIFTEAICLQNVEDVYKSIEANKHDLSEVVLSAYKILSESNSFSPLINNIKSEMKSNVYRENGNKEFLVGDYQKALEYYNKALMFAPNKSTAMKLAFSNRSALALRMKAFSACIKDIDTCFAMGCPGNIKDKLRKRRSVAENSVWVEHLVHQVTRSPFYLQFYKVKGKLNPDISSVTANIGVTMSKGEHKLVATTNIQVGAVVAVETTFASFTNPNIISIACHYCHKMSFTLVPCDTCCDVLFCDQECKTRCIKEYHDIECQIFTITKELYRGHFSKLVFIATMRMKNESKDWQEFIELSKVLGEKRRNMMSVKEIFDVNNKLSMLCFDDKKVFLESSIFNASFGIASVIYHLKNIPGFFPIMLNERNLAIKAFVRIMMYLSLYVPSLPMYQSVENKKKSKTDISAYPSFGWFPFIGKIKKACYSNLLPICLNKKLALVALQPIKQGEELTIPYLGHWLDQDPASIDRVRMMFHLYEKVCKCALCTGEYTKMNNTELSPFQLKHYKQLNFFNLEFDFDPTEVKQYLQKLSKVMAIMHNVPFTKEYTDVYRIFRLCLLQLQDAATENWTCDI